MSQAVHPEPVPRGQTRASDAERQAVVDALRRSLDEGRLTLAEFDERSGHAYAARTWADLAVLTADLPVERRPLAQAAAAPPADGAQVVPGRDGAPLAWRVVGSAWFAATFINLVIWAVVSIASGDAVYPWWLWVGGPWGAVLLVGWLSGLGRGERDDG